MKNVQKEIENKNPWYVDSQHDQLLIYGKRLRERYMLWQEILLKLNFGRSAKVLEVGCGDGVNFKPIADIFEAAGVKFTYCGVDYNPLRIARAKSKYPDGNFFCEDLLEWQNVEDFDFVFCNQVLEHVPNPDSFLLKIRSLMGQNAYLLLGVPNEGCFLAWVRNHVLERSILRTTDHVNFFTKSVVERLSRNSGFDVVVFRRIGFMFPTQRINFFLSNVCWGECVFSFCRKFFPSQSGEIQVLLKKDPEYL